MKTTLPEILHPLMKCPSIIAPRCKICGRVEPLEQHHMVRRGAGELIDENGRKLKKPTITLCGFGNNLKDADGRYYCHGLAHHQMLHFRYVKADRKRRYVQGKVVTNTFDYSDKVYVLEFLITKEPTKYQDALEMDGWRRV